METYGFKFVVDANDAAKGWKQFESAIDGVFSSLDKMEAHVAQTMATVRKVSKTGGNDLSKFAKQFRDLNNVKFNGKVTTDLSKLSAVMDRFKAPNETQIKNTRTFFRTLQATGDIPNVARTVNSIGSLKGMMAGFKAPTPAQIKNFRAFGTAVGAVAPQMAKLKSLRGISGIANELASISLGLKNFKAPSKTNVANLQGFFNALGRYKNGGAFTNASGLYSFLNQISRFKAPSATQIKNLREFINTVGNLKMPRNGTQIAGVLDKIGRSAGVANRQLRGLKGNVNGMGWGRFNTGVRSARVNMMGLQNAFSATYQAGSLLRSLFGTLTIAEIGRSFFEATNNLQVFAGGMKVIGDKTFSTAQQIEFITGVTRELGTVYSASLGAFSKFAISSDKAGASAAQTRDIFQGFSVAFSGMGLSAEKTNDVMLAMQQIMNKGYLAAEELNQQLNEHLPGALGYLRQELAKSGIALEDALKKKMIDGTQGLLFLASKYRDDFAPALTEALMRPQAQANILRTNITKLMETMAANGGNESFVRLLQRLNSFMKPEDVERYGKILGEKLGKVVDKLTMSIEWLARNWDSLKGPLSTTLSLLGKWMVISGSLQIGSFIVTPLLNVGLAAKRAIPHLGQTLLLVRSLNAASMAGLLTSVRGMNPATLAMLTNFRNVKKTITTMPKKPFAGIATAAKTGVEGLKNMSKATLGWKGAALGAFAAFTGGLKLAFSIARDENKSYAHDSFTTWEIVKGSFLLLTDQIGTAWTATTEYMGKVLDAWGIDVGGIFTGLWNFIKEVFMGISFAANVAAEAMGRAFLGFFRGIGNQISLAGSMFSNLFSGNWAEAMSDGMALATFEGMTKGFNDSFKGFSKTLDYNNFKGNVEKGYGQFSKGLAVAGQRGRGTETNLPKPGVPTLDDLASLYDPESLLRDAEADKDSKGGKKKKGPKGKSPEQLLKAARREAESLYDTADQIMRRFAEDSPVLKVQQDYINDLREQAKGLLGEDAYGKWMKDVIKSGGEAESMMYDLVDALEATGGNTKELKVLSALYGVSVDDLTDKLYDQIEAYKYKLKMAKEEATFGATLLRQSKNEILLGAMGEKQARITAQVMDAVADARSRNQVVTQEMITGLTTEITKMDEFNETLRQQQEFFENNGLRSYMDDLRQVGEVVHDLDFNFLQSMEDTLFNLGKTGKLSLSGIFDTVQDGLLRFASQGITEQFTKMIMGNGDSENPSIFGGLFKAMGFDTGFQKKTPLGANFGNPMFVTVTNTGDLRLGSATAGGGLLGDGSILVQGQKDDGFQEMIENSMNPAMENVAEHTESTLTQTMNSVGLNMNSVFMGVIGGIAGLFGGGKTGSIIGGIAGIGLSMFGGGSGGNILAGIFKEGGYSDQPVSLASLPHYAEGTHNTSGGIPAMLHDNEAVIPLSRGRKVPVEVNSDLTKAGKQVINNNFNISTPDADSFKRSRQQITSKMHMDAGRAYRRNNA